jgi:hypothetical protein
MTAFDPHAALADLRALRSASIDCCSLIYMHQAGFLDAAASVWKLTAAESIAAEYGLPLPPGIRVVQTEQRISPDAQVVRIALRAGCAVISEDRAVLLAARRRNVPYFNALMALIGLAARGALDARQYRARLRLLENIARYSPAVVQCGRAVARAAGLG